MVQKRESLGQKPGDEQKEFTKGGEKPPSQKREKEEGLKQVPNGNRIIKKKGLGPRRQTARF